MKEYVVFERETPDDTFAVYRVKNAPELWDKIAERYGLESAFVKWVRNTNPSEGLMQYFYFDEYGDLYDSHTDNLIRRDIVSKFSGDLKKIELYIQQKISTNVYEYFGIRRDFARLYLHKWLKDKAVPFPNDMYKYCFIKEMNKDQPYVSFFVREIAQK